MTHFSFFRTLRARVFLACLGIVLLPRAFSRAADPAPAKEDDTGILKLNNPLQADSLIELIVQVTQIALAGTAIIAVTMIIYGGVMMIMSGGKEENVQKGKDTLLWAVVGLAIVLFSGVIMRFVITGLDPGAVIGQE